MSTEAKQEEIEMFNYIKRYPKFLWFIRLRGLLLNPKSLQDDIARLTQQQREKFKSLQEKYDSISRDQFIFFLGVIVSIVGNLVAGLVPESIKQNHNYPTMIILIFLIAIFLAVNTMFDL